MNNFFKFPAAMLCLFLSISSLNVFADSLLGQSAPQSQDASWLKILNFVTLSSSEPQKVNMANDSPIRYIEPILRALESSKTLEHVLGAILSGQNNLLNKNEQFVLLSLCAFEQSRQRQVIDSETWVIVKDKVGEPKYMNIFLDPLIEDSEHSNYCVYAIDLNKFIFIQLVGRGAHNSSFLVWMIQKTQSKAAQIRLMKIKMLASDKKSFIITHELNAQKVSYDQKEKKLIVHTSLNDRVNYKIDVSRLLLVQKNN